MKISHLSKEKNPNSIEVRNYNDNSTIVHFPTSEKSKDNTNIVGSWNVKYIEYIPKEYNYLNENITFLPKTK